MGNHQKATTKRRTGPRRVGQEGTVSAAELLKRAREKESSPTQHIPIVTDEHLEQERGAAAGGVKLEERRAARTHRKPDTAASTKRTMLDIALTIMCAIVTIAAIVLTFTVAGTSTGLILIAAIAVTVLLSVGVTMWVKKRNL